MTKKFTLMVGRWQPLHEGHLYLFRKRIEAGENVLVAIRDVEKDEKNPYSVFEVKNFFYCNEETFKWIVTGRMKVIIIDDIDCIAYGRNVGYRVEQMDVPPEIAAISATEIRAQAKREGRL